MLASRSSLAIACLPSPSLAGSPSPTLAAHPRRRWLARLRPRHCWQPSPSLACLPSQSLAAVAAFVDAALVVAGVRRHRCLSPLLVASRHRRRPSSLVASSQPSVVAAVVHLWSRRLCRLWSHPLNLSSRPFAVAGCVASSLPAVVAGRVVVAIRRQLWLRLGMGAVRRHCTSWSWLGAVSCACRPSPPSPVTLRVGLRVAVPLVGVPSVALLVVVRCPSSVALLVIRQPSWTLTFIRHAAGWPARSRLERLGPSESTGGGGIKMRAGPHPSLEGRGTRQGEWWQWTRWWLSSHSCVRYRIAGARARDLEFQSRPTSLVGGEGHTAGRCGGVGRAGEGGGTWLKREINHVQHG